MLGSRLFFTFCVFYCPTISSQLLINWLLWTAQNLALKFSAFQIQTDILAEQSLFISWWGNLCLFRSHLPRPCGLRSASGGGANGFLSVKRVKQPRRDVRRLFMVTRET